MSAFDPLRTFEFPRYLSLMVRFRVFAGILAAVFATSCSNDAERNIILDTAPFFQQDVRYEPGGDERIISSVRSFAEANRMDFLLARESLPPPDFNVHAASHELNLQVIQSIEIDGPWHAKIIAIARGKPTQTDRAKLREFVDLVQKSAASPT